MIAASGAALPFARLSPDAVLEAAEALSLDPDGRLFALNSYENRVYRVGRWDQPPVVMKFYRPGRWSEAQIGEEHEFALELAAADVPVVPPLRIAGRTLHAYDEFAVAVYALEAGTSPDLDQPEARELLGRTLARIHAIGARRAFRERVPLWRADIGERIEASVARSTLLPEHMREEFCNQAQALLAMIGEALAAPLASIRLHGDCHLGNILWHARGPLFVDLDDCAAGPRIQDLWMFLSGTEDEQRFQCQQLLQGYRQFGAIAYHEFALVEPLRALRMLRHAAWLVDRWHDPAFPRAFPWAGEARWWEQYVNDLRRQREILQEPPVDLL